MPCEKHLTPPYLTELRFISESCRVFLERAFPPAKLTYREGTEHDAFLPLYDPSFSIVIYYINIRVRA